MGRRDKLFPDSIELPHCPKSGVLLYVEDWDAIRDTTTPEQRAIFVDAMVDFVHFGLLPNFDTEPILRVCWGFVHQKLIRDQIDYNYTVWKNRYTAYKRGFKEESDALSAEEWIEKELKKNQSQPVATSGYPMGMTMTRGMGMTMTPTTGTEKARKRGCGEKGRKNPVFRTLQRMRNLNA